MSCGAIRIDLQRFDRAVLGRFYPFPIELDKFHPLGQLRLWQRRSDKSSAHLRR